MQKATGEIDILWVMDVNFVCDHEFGIRYMRVNDGTESELQQAVYQEESREWRS